jgi:sensor c-di-GMP phosphodiesterase-like protein
MVYTVKQRVAITFVVTALAAVFGAGGGYLLGRAIALQAARSRIEQYAASILKTGAISLEESYTVVGSMKASRYPLCSDAEIEYFRTLVFPSQYLKDVGRMQNGRVLCSANLGRLTQPSPQFKPDFVQPNGSRLYKNMGPYRISGYTVTVFQLGDFYTVLSPETERRFNSGPLHFTVTSLANSKQPHHVLGEFHGAPETILTQEGQGNFEYSLYATHCNPRYSTCITVYDSIPNILRAERNELDQSVLFGAVIAATFGFFFSILYRRSRSMEQQLRRALRGDRLRVVYQPIVELASRRIVGAEALLRWTDEDGFSVGPDIFVKLAEELGIVDEVTQLVVRKALHDFGGILRDNTDFSLSINVTAADLVDAGFLPMLDRNLQHYGIAAQSLIIEITESSTVRHEVAIETTRQLHRQGHQVHIDDFGTGYSSLAYLHQLSVDAIKIDKTFTHAIGTEAVTTAILPQIRSMARALNLQVVVEGIETEEQASYFADADRTILAQGWLFGRPVPVEDFQRLVANGEQN